MNRNAFETALHAAIFISCVAVIPVISVLLVREVFGVPLSEFRPYLNDEVWYWHQIWTFSRVGWSGGYYTVAELTNPANLSPFGPHGPVYPILYGSIGAVLGWHRHSGVVLNLIAVAVATWAFLDLSRIGPARTLLFGLLLATFWPLLFWAPSNMQEGFHHAGAILAAGFFVYALVGKGRSWPVAAGWVWLSLLTLTRPSWGILLPAWALVSAPASASRLATARRVTLGVGVAALLVAGYAKLVTPLPTGFFFVKVVRLDVGLEAVSRNISWNLSRLLNVNEYRSLELVHRAQFLAWSTIVTGLALGLAARRRPAAPYLLLSGFGTGAAVVLMLVLYTLTNWAEHRVLSSFLLFAAAVAVAAPGRLGPVLTTLLIVSNVASTPIFLETFREVRNDNFLWDPRPTRAFAEAIEGRVVYRPHASRWCNTLLSAQFPPDFVALPAGIGISYFREADQLILPPKSRYLLLDSVAAVELPRPLRLREIARFSYGTLYVNEESACGR